MQRGERYAQVTEEVLSSVAYGAIPDFAKVVLFAVACRFCGRNNGNLSLVPADATALGVRHSWRLYAGLKLLVLADLIVCTRRGRLERGTRLCSLYALTWRGIDSAPDGVSFDAGVSAHPLPTHAWSKWTKPVGWARIVKDAGRTAHGQKKISMSPTGGDGRATTLGLARLASEQLRGVKDPPLSAPTVVAFSEISPQDYPESLHSALRVQDPIRIRVDSKKRKKRRNFSSRQQSLFDGVGP
jgi:hypothetical protein